jgi:hypothetical protein
MVRERDNWEDLAKMEANIELDLEAADRRSRTAFM